MWDWLKKWASWLLWLVAGLVTLGTAFIFWKRPSLVSGVGKYIPLAEQGATLGRKVAEKRLEALKENARRRRNDREKRNEETLAKADSNPDDLARLADSLADQCEREEEG